MGKRVKIEREADLEAILRRYDSLPEDDRDRIFRVFRYVTMSLSTGEPISLGTRLAIAERWGKEPVELIARAAYLFIEANGMRTGKRNDYFIGIVNRSAKSWYIEYRNLKDKSGFGLE